MRSNSALTDQPQSWVKANEDKCVIAQSSISTNLTHTTIPQAQDGRANSAQNSTVTAVNTQHPVCEPTYSRVLNVCEEKNQTDGSYSLKHSNNYTTEINSINVFKDLYKQVSNHLKAIESSFDENCLHCSIIGMSLKDTKSQVFLDRVGSLALYTATELKSFQHNMELERIRPGMVYKIIDSLAEIKSDFQTFIEVDTEKTEYLFKMIDEFQKEAQRFE